MLFCIYGRYPDHSYLRLGDAYSIQSDHYTFRAVSERAWAYQDFVGVGFLKFLIEANRDRPRNLSAGEEYISGVLDGRSGYYYFLFYDPKGAADSHTLLPKKKLFSPEGTGMVVWKSGWGEGDTTIFFKCGNYFGDHGHFDQGHLDIYRRRPLLIDSGSYVTFRGPFRMEYWRKTVAHNSILLVDPAISNDEGGQRVFHSQSDATIEEYLGNQESETGNIVDYRVEAGLAYVAGDLTSAYPSERALRVTRELTLLGDRHLLVLDRVMLSTQGLDPRILWHCPVKPAMDRVQPGFTVAREGARAAVRVLLPEGAEINWVEGFRVGEEVYDASDHRRALADQGVGRVEVSASQLGSEQIVFLHVIDIGDDSDVEETVSASLNNSTIKVLIGQRELFFRRDDWGLVRWSQ
jgi:heparin/heparan-sulfate lyase